MGSSPYPLRRGRRICCKMPAPSRNSRSVLVASLGPPMEVVRSLKHGTVVAVLGLLVLPVSSLGDLEHDLSARSSTQAQLRASITAETRRIETTRAGVQAAEARLAALQSAANAREAELAAVQRDVVSARNRLTRLENRLHDAASALASNLVAAYKDEPPDVVTVVLESHGFADMLENLQFMERVRRHDARILADARTARRQLLAESARLQRLLVRDRALAVAVQRSRAAAAAVQGALLTREAEQLQRRATTAARLTRVRAQVGSLRRQIARLAARRQAAATRSVDLPVEPGGMAQAPAGAPSAVRQV